MVGLLRSGGAEPEQVSYGPTPGLADLAELVRKTSETAEFSAFGTLPRLSPAWGLSAYRVVQESLTNVLKHAGPGATARVTIAYTAESHRNRDQRQRLGLRRAHRPPRPWAAGHAGTGRAAWGCDDCAAPTRGRDDQGLPGR